MVKSSAVANQFAALGLTWRRLVVVLSALLLIFVAFRGLTHLKCVWMKPRADEAMVEEAMLYIRDNVNEPEAQNMYSNWKMMAKMFPVVRIDVCEGEELAYQCKLQREEMTIGQAIWYATGDDAVAYRAMAMFGEYQHTKTGGNHFDDQPTQEIFERVRRALPKRHQTRRIGLLHHKGTVNHGF